MRISGNVRKQLPFRSEGQLFSVTGNVLRSLRNRHVLTPCPYIRDVSEAVSYDGDVYGAFRTGLENTADFIYEDTDCFALVVIEAFRISCQIPLGIFFFQCFVIQTEEEICAESTFFHMKCIGKSGSYLLVHTQRIVFCICPQHIEDDVLRPLLGIISKGKITCGIYLHTPAG